MAKRKAPPRQNSAAQKSAAQKKITLFPKATALTIGGSDCSGGAGIQADIKTFQQVGAYGMSVLTLITAQNTVGVQSLQMLDPVLALAQLDSVLADIPPRAAKTGALGSVAMIKAIAQRAETFSFPLIVDPVMISKHGAPLLPAEAIDTLRRRLLPRAYLITPNRFEAEKLTGTPFSVLDEDAVAKTIDDLQEMGAENVLLKLGRVGQEFVCVLGTKDRNIGFHTHWIDSPNTHGTGCALSAAITARLAIGFELESSVRDSIDSVANAVHAGQPLGAGHRPIEFRAIAAAQ